MLEIVVNDIKLGKKEQDIIKDINEIIIDSFHSTPMKKNTIRVFILPEEEYYSMLGYDKPYRNLVKSDGFYHGEYQEIFLNIKAKSIIRTYIHEIGHFIDYNIDQDDKYETSIGSLFSRKLQNDMVFEDELLEDLKKMPAFTLINVAGGTRYGFSGDEIFARIFEVFIWEKLGRKYFTPDLYIKTPSLFLKLNLWLKGRKQHRSYSYLSKLHLFLLKGALKKRKVFDPYREDRFSKYIFNLLDCSVTKCRIPSIN